MNDIKNDIIINHNLAPYLTSLESAEESESIAVRELMSWFGAERRGYMVAYRIRKALQSRGVATKPDFDSVPINARVKFVRHIPTTASLEKFLTVPELPPTTDLSPTLDIQAPELIYGAVSEPAFLVSRFDAANASVISVKPDQTLTEAVTLMLRHDYSQLPVMIGDREVKGVISWESIGPALALKDSTSGCVRDYMKGYHEIKSTDSIFAAIPRIVKDSYVLVRNSENKISGIITTTDLSIQFQQLSEPFLLLAEIENHIRKLIDGKFTKDQLSKLVHPSDTTRTIETVADLTFGEYIRLFENPDLWQITGIKIDRKIFVKELDKVREIRNDVMHFDPDGITPDNHELLLNFVRFIHEIQELTPPVVAATKQ